MWQKMHTFAARFFSFVLCITAQTSFLICDLSNYEEASSDAGLLFANLP
jgi:hypothetical protein